MNTSLPEARSSKMYADLWASPTDLQANIRSQRISEIVSRFFVGADTTQVIAESGKVITEIASPRSVLEIGSGMGAVTAAYRKLFLGIPIHAIDIDSRAAENAKANEAHFVQSNVLKMTGHDVQNLATESGLPPFDHLVALKTAAEVVKHIIELLKAGELGSVTSFLSLIEETDQKFLPEISRELAQLSDYDIVKLYLHESRAYHEVAWLIKPR